MGLYLNLLALMDWESLGSRLWMIGSVAAGLGFVIFVHELGHFLVAKWCGVKCEKFYVGFDVPIKILGIQLPSKLVHFQWGETEYGVGIIPLGGYVKMLGQDDDPRAAQAEMERIKIKKQKDGEPNAEGKDGEPKPATAKSERAEAISEGTAAEGMDDGKTVEAADQEEDYELDPRSFPAKTVPQRMGIISAGVIMNLIFAVIFATFAFRSGVEYTPCEVGSVVQGSPAWKHGILPGSVLVQIGDSERRKKYLRFDWDLANGVNMVDDGEELLVAVVDLNGDEHTYSMLPDVFETGTGWRRSKRRLIGISPARTTKLAPKKPAVAGTSAAEATPPLQGKDVVTAIDGVSVKDAYALDAILAANPDRQLKLTIERRDKDDKSETSPPQTIDVVVQPNALRRIGVVMKVGPVVAVRPGSPAEQAGFREGDVIETIAGERFSDPMSLPGQIRKSHETEIEVAVRRADEIVTLKVTPITPTSFDWTVSMGSPVASEALGLALRAENEIEAVSAESAAERAGIKPGDVVSAFGVLYDNPKDRAERRANSQDPLEVDGSNVTWPLVFDAMQRMKSDQSLSLSVQRGDQTELFKLKPEASDEFNPDRGFLFVSKQDEYVAETWAEAFALGRSRTWEDANRVLLFLKKLVTRKIALTNVGGPLTIAYVAGSEASGGLPRLLIFLTFLSANLAVINFMPIPALDGGHFVFLCWEGISGKPVSERVQIALTLAGVACLLCLMIFVVTLDINRLFF